MTELGMRAIHLSVRKHIKSFTIDPSTSCFPFAGHWISAVAAIKNGDLVASGYTADMLDD